MTTIAVILYIVIITLLDVWIYGSHEKNPEKFKWLFNPVIRYRILQKLWEIAGLGAIYLLFGIYPVMGLLIGHYCLLYDRLYYLFNRQEYLLFDYQERDVNVFWLRKIWNIGFFALRPFQVWKFNLVALIGFTIAIIFSII